MDAQSNSTPMKSVYTIVDRGQNKSFWTRVGVGFTNKDGSLSLRLDAIPVNGTLHVRDWEPPQDRINWERRGDQSPDTGARGARLPPRHEPALDPLV